MLLRMPRAPMQPLQLWPLAMLACRVHCRYPAGLEAPGKGHLNSYTVKRKQSIT